MRDYQSDWNQIFKFCDKKSIHVPTNFRAFEIWIKKLFNTNPGLFWELTNYLNDIDSEIEKMIIENRKRKAA